jgi:hypothetical protein
VGAIDQGTTSTRFMVFDHGGNEVGRHQLEHQQILPRAGWVEHDPVEIWERTRTVVKRALGDLRLHAPDLAAIGVTKPARNDGRVESQDRPAVLQRHRVAGHPHRPDRLGVDRDGRGEVIRRKAGLPPATYFSGGKIQWILENVDGVRDAAERGDAIFGNTDSWLLWNLTGGPDGGAHVTDVTNASRTMLMNLELLDWDDELLGFFDIPRSMLPEIRPPADPKLYGTTRPAGPFAGEVALAGDLGDQQAAMVGQVCFSPGEAKNTYGTGNFLLLVRRPPGWVRQRLPRLLRQPEQRRVAARSGCTCFSTRRYAVRISATLAAGATSSTSYRSTTGRSPAAAAPCHAVLRRRAQVPPEDAADFRRATRSASRTVDNSGGPPGCGQLAGRSGCERRECTAAGGARRRTGVSPPREHPARGDS